MKSREPLGWLPLLGGAVAVAGAAVAATLAITRGTDPAHALRSAPRLAAAPPAASASPAAAPHAAGLAPAPSARPMNGTAPPPPAAALTPPPSAAPLAPPPPAAAVAAPAVAATAYASEPELPAGQVWECEIAGQRIFSDKPCGAHPAIRTLGATNVMDPADMPRADAGHYPSAAYQPPQGFTDDGDEEEQVEPTEAYGAPIVVLPDRHRHFHRRHEPSRPAAPHARAPSGAAPMMPRFSR